MPRQDAQRSHAAVDEKHLVGVRVRVRVKGEGEGSGSADIQL